MTTVDAATLAEAARQLRAVLAELDDPDVELTASAASKRRIEGAAIALDALASESSASVDRA